MNEKPSVAGIICEYNPLHRGHALCLQAMRKSGNSHIVCVMSGNYVQRGEPAILNKWARTECALNAGADLVAELPCAWAMAGAETFALGAVSMLHRLGCIDELWFGSECGNAQQLFNLAEILQTEAFSASLRSFLGNGISFASARQNAVQQLCGAEKAALLESANNTLGIEYCKAILKLNSSMRVRTLKRDGAGHDQTVNLETEDSVLSASQIRAMVQNNEDISSLLPDFSEQILKREIALGRAPCTVKNIEMPILACLRSMTVHDFSLLPDISEGLEHRLHRTVRTATSLSEVFDGVKSKRYSHARIRRIILSAFLGIQKKSVPSVPPYFRILGMNERGREILKIAKKNKQIPIVARAGDILTLDKNALNVFELEQRSTDLYGLCSPDIQPCGLEFTKGIITQ